MKTQNDLTAILNGFEAPILIVSTIAGRGVYSIGEALKERFTEDKDVYHIPIEEMLPHNALKEDYLRYNFISNNLPFLLNLVYRVPIFYYRKLFREKYLKTTDLNRIKEKIDTLGIKTVICASHRPAFWLSCLKSQKHMNFKLWGMLSEFGRSLGWKYIFWESLDGYFSPVERQILDFQFPDKLRYVKIELPCKREYYSLAQKKGDKNKILFVAGYWGQIFIRNCSRILGDLLKGSPSMQIFVVCGKNEKLYMALSNQFSGSSQLKIYGEVSSLINLMQECASIITKPGISTLLEAHAAGRKIFLLKGMPVAEDNNARYAMKYYGAKWFSVVSFKKWYFNK